MFVRGYALVAEALTGFSYSFSGSSFSPPSMELG